MNDMEKSSFASCPNYFDGLRLKTREIDEGIDRLTETWRMPQLLIGGYAGCSAESNAYLEKLWESIRSTDNVIEQFQLELGPSLEETDQLLKESQAIYDNLKEQCDSLNIVMAEYGYHYEESNNMPESYQQNDSKDNTDNILTSERMPDVEVEFTPDLTWKCKARSKESSVSKINQKNTTIKGIATPVIKSLQSVLQSEFSNAKGSYDTPVRESNNSKRLTRVLKK